MAERNDNKGTTTGGAQGNKSGTTGTLDQNRERDQNARTGNPDAGIKGGRMGDEKSSKNGLRDEPRDTNEGGGMGNAKQNDVRTTGTDRNSANAQTDQQRDGLRDEDETELDQDDMDESDDNDEETEDQDRRVTNSDDDSRSKTGTRTAAANH